jgi:hypothetical protein
VREITVAGNGPLPQETTRPGFITF